MGIAEIIGLVALKQVATAVKNVCTVGQANTTSPLGKEAWGQGAQIADQVAQAAGKGLAAASGEFAAQQALDTTVITDEKGFAAWLQTLPAPTP
jgi:hypothetical protein